MNKHNWKGINYPSKIDDWETFEKNNTTIVLNILYTEKKEICPAYISKINSNRTYIIKSNSIKTLWSFLFLEQKSSFLQNRK